MTWYIHNLRIEQNNFSALQQLINEHLNPMLDRKEINAHGFGHNNAHMYMIYASTDISEFIGKKGFCVTVKTFSPTIGLQNIND